MSRIACLFAVVLGLLLPALAGAQVIIIPSEHYRVTGAAYVKSIAIEASVRDQVAEVSVAQVFQNASSLMVEASCIFPVPADATVSNFVLMIDGKEVPAKIYTKEEAHRIYESIVRMKKDPALLEFMGYGAVKTSVFPLPPHGQRKVTLRYTQVCRRDRDMTELLLPLSAGKLSSRPLDELNLTVRLDSPGRLKSVYSPAYAISVDRPGENSATVRFRQGGTLPADDLRLIWTTSDQPVGATVLSYRPNDRENGYFLLLASPDVKGPEGRLPSKTIVFALDRSGSMAGQKIEQARNALKFVLNNLRDGDTFNIIAYDDRVETFKPELQRYNEETRAAAVRFVDSITDGGSTNIDGALRRAMELIGDTGRASYVIFLTDGLPTAGEVNEGAIAAHLKANNRSRARLFAFGVGFDVNARLLDRLTTENFGTCEYVRPNENIESAVAKFYGRMTAPVLAQVRMELAGMDLDRVYPKDLPDLFAGGQIVAVGRYRGSGPVTLKLSGKVGDMEQSFTYPVTLAGASSDETYAFVEKLWATRRVGQILNELDLHGRNQELIDELVRLSTRHGILTPYTAFLADERTDLHAFRDNGKRVEVQAFEDKASSFADNQTGAAGVNLRIAKQQLQNGVQSQQSGAQYYAGLDGKQQIVDRLQVVGNRALYRRANRWVDPGVSPAEEKSAEQVEQFSERYFELARTNAKLRQYLALPEGCTVRIDGRIYQINAQQATKG